MPTNKWATEVSKHSNALNLEEEVFTWEDPKRIAQSLKNSAEKSEQRKETSFQSAMSMLNFYVNRAGKSLPEERKKVLGNAKIELRLLYGKTLKSHI